MARIAGDIKTKGSYRFNLHFDHKKRSQIEILSKAQVSEDKKVQIGMMMKLVVYRCCF
jgi:hypothetical protein